MTVMLQCWTRVWRRNKGVTATQTNKHTVVEKESVSECVCVSSFYFKKGSNHQPGLNESADRCAKWRAMPIKGQHVPLFPLEPAMEIMSLNGAGVAPPALCAALHVRHVHPRRNV